MSLRTMNSPEPLVEAIRDGEIVKIPENVALEEDLFVLRKIEDKSSSEENAGQPYEFKGSHYKINDWKQNISTVKKNDVIKDLIPNFHWTISRQRRLKGISRKQLGNEIGCSEEEVKMIELGDLPYDDFVLINGIEKKLNLNLRIEKVSESPTLADLQKMKEDKARGAIKETHRSQMRGETKPNNSLEGSDIDIIDLD